MVETLSLFEEDSSATWVPLTRRGKEVGGRGRERERGNAFCSSAFALYGYVIVWKPAGNRRDRRDRKTWRVEQTCMVVFDSF
jgi:hypothetical protein